MSIISFIDNLDYLARNTLSKERYAHSLSVAKTARDLAERFKYPDPDLVYLTGLGHDIAREMPIQDLAFLARSLGRYREVDIDFPLILHGRVAAHIIYERIGFYSPQVDEACCLHTTGRFNMTPLDQLIYIADYIEPLRPYMTTNVNMDLSQHTLQSLSEYALHETVNYMNAHHKKLYPDTEEWLNKIENKA